MAATKIFIDAGPLVGFLVSGDQYHQWSARVWGNLREPMWTCEAVLSESVFLLQSTGNSLEPLLELFERDLVRIDFAVSTQLPDVWALMRKYRDVPMSLADACLVRLAELNNRCQVFTTDKHFLLYRRKGRGVIPLLAPF